MCIITFSKEKKEEKKKRRQMHAVFSDAALFVIPRNDFRHILLPWIPRIDLYEKELPVSHIQYKKIALVSGNGSIAVFLMENISNGLCFRN